jgi:hypothetical protein
MLVRGTAMSDQKSSRPANYIVGYRRPPKETQFRAGKSGNPRGRPKGTRPVGAVLQDIIQQRVTVTESGKTRRIPALEVMLRRLVNDAMRGDQRAIKLLLLLVDRYSDSPGTAPQLHHLLAEDEAILTQYLRDLQEPAGLVPDPPSTPDGDGHDAGV